MSFLHKLWDETLAGPAPESGLGKLRKYNSFSAVRAAPLPVIVSHDHTPVSCSIIRSVSNLGNTGSAPASPAAPTTPTSPFSPSTPHGDFKRIARRKISPENTDPIVYDWIMINALDR